MAYTKEYRAEIEQKLSRVAPITIRPMFGGLGIYSEGVIFAIADDGRLYFKTSDLNRSDFEAKGMGPFIYAPGAPPSSYWELPHGVIDEPEDLQFWVEKALAASAQTKRKKK